MSFSNYNLLIFENESKTSTKVETHVVDMAFHLSTDQHSFLFALSAHERMASVAQNTYTHLDSRAFNGRIFA
jgi:hypothetical protein